ncbi:uncharacterized protein LOC119718747 [Patiria miniata]|uniref:RING-type domain-containing protein n=1 Tax=Patiria miniata TaxID=46514 RepID=A0A913YXI2_PATMI|nr:uncharacterized protein LOC119718747 [Patiria miniata]
MDHQPPVNSSTEELTDAQHNFEKRFSCPVCLDPKLKMVVSSCQHRTCSDCLYDQTDKLRVAMKKCPTCQRENAYPEDRPDIPEDNILIQRQLGVTECPLDGCKAGLWMWDVEKHIESCPHAVVSPKPKGGKKRALKADESTDTPPAAKQRKKAESVPRTRSRAPNEGTTPPVRVTRSNSSNAGQAQQLNRYPLRTTYQRRALSDYNQQCPNNYFSQYPRYMDHYSSHNFRSQVCVASWSGPAYDHPRNGNWVRY